jgi:hypothetical protein
MRKYEPDERGRAIVMRLGAVPGIDLESIAFAVENPRTGKPINVKTLKKVYAKELRLAKVEIQDLTMNAFIQGIKDGNPAILKIALSTYCNIREGSGGAIEISQNHQTIQIVGIDPIPAEEPMPTGNVTDLMARHDALVRLPSVDALPLPGESEPKAAAPRTELDIPGATTPWYKRPLTGKMPQAGGR